MSREGRERVLREALRTVRDQYDFILIDCPPSLGLITLNVLAAADAVLIPIQCEYYALEGISQLLNTVHVVQQNFNPSLAIDGVLLTMYDARLNLCRQVANDAREYFGDKVFTTVIPRTCDWLRRPASACRCWPTTFSRSGPRATSAPPRSCWLGGAPRAPWEATG